MMMNIIIYFSIHNIYANKLFTRHINSTYHFLMSSKNVLAASLHLICWARL